MSTGAVPNCVANGDCTRGWCAGIGVCPTMVPGIVTPICAGAGVNKGDGRPDYRILKKMVIFFYPHNH